MSELSRLVAAGESQRPESRDGAELLQRKGDEHEIRYLNELRQRGTVCEMPARSSEPRTMASLIADDAATRAAMDEGHDYIYQATFFDEVFQGRADFLHRIDDNRLPRGYGYEVLDTKLARSAKASFLVQLCAYSEHVGRLQGDVLPLAMRVALGSGEERRFNVKDYIAYYRQLRESFLRQIEGLSAYPYECSHCTVCDWNDACASQRRRDDHLSNVAWMRRDQVDKLTAAGIGTGSELANASPDTNVGALSRRTFQNLQTQARLQREQTDAIAAGKPPGEWYRYEFREFDPHCGFALLPQPDEGDVYFDMEGDPYYAPDTGLEYLFGVYLSKEDRYLDFWAHSLAEEQQAASELIRFVLERRRQYPNMHVYHYASYEKTRLGNLTTRYKVYEDAFDDLLRAGVLVDLFTVVRQGLYVSQDSYSIKKLEPFYGFKRDAELKRGDDSILLFEAWLDEKDDAILAKIRHYNDEDCRSTHLLHRWLLERRDELIVERGEEIPWHAVVVEPSEKREEENAETLELRNTILDGMAPPVDLAALGALSDEQRLRWFIANAVDYHRSEAKPSWWEYFNRCETADDLTESDQKCIGDLTWREEVPPYKRSNRENPIFAFSFPEQQHSLGPGDEVADARTRANAGQIVSIDDNALRLELKISRSIEPGNVSALVPIPFDTKIPRKALADIGRRYLAGRLPHEHPAIVDIVLAATPRLRDRARGERIQPKTVDGVSLAEAIAALDRSYLVVQGPPGTGKSTTGGEAIAHLLADGKRVGVMARSHSAAHNLVAAVEDAARQRNLRFSGAHKFAKERDKYQSRYGDDAYVSNAKNNAEALASNHQLVSGTNYLFAADDAVNAFDVLIVDEAGQLSIADAIACGRAAPNIVFLGDPSQLAQVSQGKHPPGMDSSILEHLLGNTPTIRENRGIFLPISYRMHPSICGFISEAIYENRLDAAEDNKRNAVRYPGKPAESGLRWRPVEHDHNASSSEAEANAVVEEVVALLEGQCATREHPLRPFTTDDVLIVSPYNAQRRLITRKLEERGIVGVRVGTVDKFQGLQAPVVIYSMATSSGETIPRNLEFLFERNRFNVAISRAQCLSILVCSPRLLEISCRTPEQMAMVNLLCAYTQAAPTPQTRPSFPVSTD